MRLDHLLLSDPSAAGRPHKTPDQKKRSEPVGFGMRPSAARVDAGLYIAWWGARRQTKRAAQPLRAWRERDAQLSGAVAE